MASQRAATKFPATRCRRAVVAPVALAGVLRAAQMDHGRPLLDTIEPYRGNLKAIEVSEIDQRLDA